MKLLLILALLLGCSMPLLANNTITSLKVENNIVYFTTAESKQHSLPGCVGAEQQQIWSLLKDGSGGKTSYNLLLLAASMNIAVAVESAGDCAASAGIEQARSITLLPD